VRAIKTIPFHAVLLAAWFLLIVGCSGAGADTPPGEQSSPSLPPPGGKGSTPEMAVFRFDSLWQGEKTGELSVGEDSDGWYMTAEALEDDDDGFFTKGDTVTVVFYRESVLALTFSLEPGETVQLSYFYKNDENTLYDLYCVGLFAPAER
jgi:hypothetical protein